MENMQNSETNMENVIAVARLYDEEAPIYDGDYSDVTTLACDEFVMRQIRAEMLRLRAENGLQMVGDIGCGTGIVPRSIPELVEDSIHYIGLDVSEGMLAEARHNLSEETDLRAGDMHNMDFMHDGILDLLLSIYGPFSYSLNPKALIREFARTIREGGRLLFMPYSARLGARLVTGFSTAHTTDTKKIFYTEQMLRELLEGSGYFTDVEIIGINYLGYLRGALEGANEAGMDNSSLQEERQLMRQLRRRLQTISSSDSIEERIAEGQEILSEFSVQAHANEYPIGSHAPGLDYITREAHLAELLGVEPGMGRFMMVKATRTDKSVESD